MGKRSNYKRIDKDFYGTVDPKAIPENFLKYVRGKEYYEPCFGAGDLADLLSGEVFCLWASDIRKDTTCINKNGLHITKEDVVGCDVGITNPPFSKEVLLPLLDHWVSLGKPVWLLLPMDLCSNKYFAPYMKKCSNIVSVGRLYWFKNEWVVKEPFDHEDLDPKWDGSIEFYDFTKGTKYYTGYLTRDGKPCKSEYVRGTENFCWMCFQSYECETIFETRGES